MRSCNPVLSVRIVRFRLFRFRSPLLSESLLFSFPSGTEMVHFPEFARIPYIPCGPSDIRNRCSQRLGFPIQKSPDRRLLASPRSLSQLTTSFIACLCQGIHTHALSSLTIKSISNTKYFLMFFLRSPASRFAPHRYSWCVARAYASCITCSK